MKEPLILEPRMHWARVKCSTKYGNGETIASLKWDGLRFELFMKYMWYFRYRAALLQVSNPKAHIEFTWGSEPAKGKTLLQILQTKIASARREVSKWENIISKARQSWDRLFPIDDDELYQKACAKLEAKKCNLIALEAELLKQKHDTIAKA